MKKLVQPQTTWPATENAWCVRLKFRPVSEICREVEILDQRRREVNQVMTALFTLGAYKLYGYEVLSATYRDMLDRVSRLREELDLRSKESEKQAHARPPPRRMRRRRS